MCGEFSAEERMPVGETIAEQHHDLLHLIESPTPPRREEARQMWAYLEAGKALLDKREKKRLHQDKKLAEVEKKKRRAGGEDEQISDGTEMQDY